MRLSRSKRFLLQRLLWVGAAWLLPLAIFADVLQASLGSLMTVLLGLTALGMLAGHEVRRHFKEARQSERESVQNADEPPCFCPGCNRMVSAQPHLAECVRYREDYPPKLVCVGPHPCPKSRATVRGLGMRYFCADWISHRFSEVAHPHPIHEGLWPTWVVGTTVARDLAAFRALPDCLEGNCFGVPVLHVPPARDGDVALCVVDLGHLPEELRLTQHHPLTHLRGIWIGNHSESLGVGRALDRFLRLSGLTTRERKAITVLFEDPDPPAELRNRLAGWLGKCGNGVSTSGVLSMASLPGRSEPPPQTLDAAPATAAGAGADFPESTAAEVVSHRARI